MSRPLELAGQKFNKLLVLEKTETRKRSGTYWLCKCDCGDTTVARGSYLKNGNTKSCGCLRLESLLERSVTHGMSNSPEYSNWLHIKQRCLNPDNIDYKDYGEKGITLQESWVDDFMAFYNHVGPRPKEGKYSIDRIDRSKGYEEGNIRWADDKTQARNKGIRRNNTSGVTGVQKHSNRYSAVWVDLQGVRHTRSFSINKYGPELAEFLAVETRELMIMRQNQIEGNYAEDYGK